eukprot:Platyproteum_vivax@DN5544_c0_g1_i1.p2
MRGRTTLFVTNLPYDYSVEDTRKLFDKYGPITRCETPKGKNFFFVEFEDDRDAEEAKMKMDRREVEGKPITVQFARQGPTRNWREQNNTEGGGRERSYSPKYRRDRSRSNDRRGRNRSVSGGRRSRDRRDSRKSRSTSKDHGRSTSRGR